MTKSARSRYSVLLLLLVFGVLFAIWRALPRDGLLDRAVPLVTSDRWLGPERRNGDVGNYVWLTNDEILLFRHNPDKTLTLLRQKVLPPGNVGAATPLPLAPLAQPSGVTISPDRASIHVLYHHNGAPRKKRMTSEFVSLRDGRSSGVLPGWALGEWCEGAQSVCECEYNKMLTATIHYYDGRKDEEIVVNGVTDSPLMTGNVWPLFVEPTGRVVARGDSYYDGIVTPAQKATLGNKLSPVCTFVEFNLKDPDKKGRIWTVPVPEDAASFYCQAGPGHDRLLWTVQSNRMPPLSAITQKLPRPFKRSSRYLCRWMVSNLDGHNMHTIAEFEISDLYFNRPDLISPQWTPDGKHISFEYKNALYLMAAE
ncbi:MAG: hypothetical protein JWL77_1426 [Chthonomonadaceae bacterium]|nr:hypothetical protein [Chthonomonadaceae bacterium]